MTLARDLGTWDGKSAAAIDAVYTRYHQDDDFLSGLITGLSDEATENGASWLLKRHLEGGVELQTVQTKKIHRALAGLTHWESRLHLLQSMQYLPVAKAERVVVERFLRACLAGSNKFVRAWAYDGLYRLALQYPTLMSEVRQLFEMAQRDEAPSVKARIRKLMADSR